MRHSGRLCVPNNCEFQPSVWASQRYVGELVYPPSAMYRIRCLLGTLFCVFLLSSKLWVVFCGAMFVLPIIGWYVVSWYRYIESAVDEKRNMVGRT